MKDKILMLVFFALLSALFVTAGDVVVKNGEVIMDENATADYYFGDGSQLTGISAGNCSSDGSCSLITYDSELNYIDNCSVDGSCSLITYDSELDYTTDTNETTRFNTLAGTDCSGTDKITGINADGTPVCEADVDTGTTYSHLSNFSDDIGVSSDWDEITDLPTATPSDGDTTHVSTADQIYDWVIGLSYITNAVSDLVNYYTKTAIEGMNTTLTNEDTLLNVRATDLNSTKLWIGESFGGDVSGTYDNLLVSQEFNNTLTDTNETTRFTNLVQDDCPANYIVQGVYDNGTVKCVLDSVGSFTNGSNIEVGLLNVTGMASFNNNLSVGSEISLPGNWNMYETGGNIRFGKDTDGAAGQGYFFIGGDDRGGADTTYDIDNIYLMAEDINLGDGVTDNSTVNVNGDMSVTGAVDILSLSIAGTGYTGTAANLNTLTDDSMADTLHRHSELSASDGSPNPAVTVDATGQLTVKGGGLVTGDSSVSTGACYAQIGNGRTGSGYAFIDLVGDTTYADYGLRIIRYNTGANAPSSITHMGTGDLSIATAHAANITFKTSGSTRLTIDKDGNVGIGTTTPSAKLDVDGTIVSGYTTISSSTDALDVSGVNTVFVNTASASVVIGGLANGVTGQVVRIVKLWSNNFMTIENFEADGTQKIYTPDTADMVFNTLGGVTMVFSGTYWYVVAE